MENERAVTEEDCGSVRPWLALVFFPVVRQEAFVLPGGTGVPRSHRLAFLCPLLFFFFLRELESI